MPAAGNYVSESDVDNWPTGYTETQKQEVIDRVEEIVERATGDYFYAKDLDVKLNGNGKGRIFPSLRQDILSVTNLYVNDIEIPSTEWSYDKDSVFVSLDAEEVGELEVLFPVGNNNVRIVGTLGWSECPVSIKKACVILCRADNDPTLYTKYYKGTEKLGDFSYSTAEKPLAGIREADVLIRPYVRKKPMIGVV